jgi:hypothetical protein
MLLFVIQFLIIRFQHFYSLNLILKIFGQNNPGYQNWQYTHGRMLTHGGVILVGEFESLIFFVAI